MSDQFGLSTQQDLKSGGDGTKLYGWNVLNSANATVMDVNITYTGHLAIVSSTTTTDVPMTHPFVYQEVTGDFDIDIALYQVNAGAFQGLMCRDVNASAGEDWIVIGWDSSQNLWWGDITNDTSTSGNLSSTNVYVRIARVGNTFTAYRKLNPGDSWTSAKVFTRTDFAGHTLQVGLYQKRSAATATVRFDYFQGTYSGAGATITAALTWPLPASTGQSTQSGNFCSVVVPRFELGAFGDSASTASMTMPKFVVLADTPPLIDSDITLPSLNSTGEIPPVNAAWTEDNPLIINGNILKGLVIPLFAGTGELLTGNVTDALLQQPISISALVVDMTIGGHCRINTPVMSADATGLTGNTASLDWRLSPLETSNTASHSSSYQGDMTFSPVTISGVVLPGATATATLQTSALLASGWGLVGSVATGDVGIPLLTDNTFAYVNIYGNGVLELLPLTVSAADGLAGQMRMPIISLSTSGSIGNTANAALVFPSVRQTDMVMYAVAIYEGNTVLLKPIVDGHGRRACV
ncbi:hypothetical protein MBAV_001427 [Candidatus Magnetobacterium bavaricum]|uniref:Uncharacterized protein n=1 Tax=Candidatus Magnetobacterium bavaricum TaxID=29290 RepID=A0A0F3H0D4_9BACT|nr:hypothetical protein MBAV_001427 [Candidatus Magnetobacterium bavaricum]